MTHSQPQLQRESIITLPTELDTDDIEEIRKHLYKNPLPKKQYSSNPAAVMARQLRAFRVLRHECVGCGRPLEDEDGRMCPDCSRKFNLQMVERRHAIKIALMRAITGTVCQDCGCNLLLPEHLGTMIFDHIDPTQKLFDIAVGLSRGYTLDIMISEVKKCRALCANDHAKRHGLLDFGRILPSTARVMEKSTKYVEQIKLILTK